MKEIFSILVICISCQLIRAQDVNANVNVHEYPGEACYRKCSENDKRICYFHFHLEHYHVLGP